MSAVKDIEYCNWSFDEVIDKGKWLIKRDCEDKIENYRLAHDGCNQLKADLLPEEWEEFQSGKIQFK